MEIRRRTRSLAGRGWRAGLVVLTAVACENIPLLPHWNADWYLPLPSRAIALPHGVIPDGMPPVNVSFAPQEQALDRAIGSLLDQGLTNARVIVEITKSVDMSGVDTLFIADTPEGLTDTSATRILVAMAIATADRLVTDTTAVSAAGLAMLQGAARRDGHIHVQVRGMVRNTSGGPVTLTAADSIHVKLAMLATIAVSR